jgi:UPF0716 protein FxsA
VILLLLVLFIAVPIAELYVIIKVGEAIGVLPTIALLIADSLIGTALLRWQGRTAWTRFRGALDQNRLPHKEVFDGAMVILGGTLLLTPGFITDVFGLFFLLPPTRAVVWQLVKRSVTARVSFGPRAAQWGYQRARGDRTGPRPGDIEGSAHEVGEEPPRMPRPPAGPDDPPQGAP